MFRSFNIRFRFIKRNYGSALYITDDKASKNFVLLTPFIDFEQQLANKDRIMENLQARKLRIDFHEIERKWTFFKNLDDQKVKIENNRQKITNSIQELSKTAADNEAEIEKLKLHAKLLKEDLKNLKSNYFEVEESVMLKILDLPNELHKETPKNSDQIVFGSQEKPCTSSSISHMEIGSKNDLFQYISPYFCYLKSDAALFEVCVLNYFKNYLSKCDFTQFSNADFVRSVVIEGCGDKYSDGRIITLENPHEEVKHTNRLHLVGGASLQTFMAYFTKHSVAPNYFPLKYFSIGRNYQINSLNSKENDLFNLNQQSSVSIFISATQDQDFLNEITEIVKDCYESLGYHFRLVYLSADKLNKSESLRISIQMYSNSRNCYVEVGNVSVYNNYLSKRLLFNYAENKERKFPNVISGNIINVQKMLACIIENHSGKIFLNNQLKKNICL